MTRMTAPDYYVVMCNLTYIHTYIYTYINTYIHTYIHTYIFVAGRGVVAVCMRISSQEHVYDK